NSANDSGGAIYSTSGTVSITNSTLSANQALTDGGGIYVLGAAALRVFSSTITNNQADSDFNGFGTGGGVYLAAGTGTRSFVNTILANNYESLCGALFCSQSVGECAGTVPSNGHLILANYDTSHCTVTGSFSLAEPKLGPL